MRVNRKTDIDILFNRETVNKYDFWTLTPFAFGISPELSAENKKKSDARRREFERKEVLDKLDPLFQHKYTRRMIVLGTEPDTAVVESLTPHYDNLKYPCESDCGVKLATCWLRKRKGKTGWSKWSRQTCLLTTIK